MIETPTGIQEDRARSDAQQQRTTGDIAARSRSHAMTMINPDPMRAHGAWVYLFVSIASGALLGAGRGVEPALLVGTAFAGAFMCTSALVVGVRRKLRQFSVGMAAVLLVIPPALWLGVEPRSLVVVAAATVPAAGAVLLAAKLGLLSRAALVLGIAALVMAAPAAAFAGGSSLARASALFALLWPFFCWRSARLAARLEGNGPWNRDELRAQGLREARVAALWGLAVVITLQLGID